VDPILVFLGVAVNALLLAGVFLVAVILDLGVMAWYRRRLQHKGLYPKASESKAFMVGGYSPLLDWIQSGKPAIKGIDWKINSSIYSRPKIDLRSHLAAWSLPALELVVLAVWALFIGREYLNFDPWEIPAGNEFSSAIQAHHLWTRFQACGWCALWDGSERGGFPAFVDPLASALHPLVMVTTLIFGVINGAKIALIASLWVAGFAQWWLGRVLKFGALARLWGALMVMVGGHLAGKMELGIFSVVLSTAMVSLTFAPAIGLIQNPTRRSAIILGVILALLAVSGQGYMQVGFMVMAPAYLILIWGPKLQMRRIFEHLLLAAGIGLLLAAPFLVPFLHFWPNFVKDGDPGFSAGQPLAYYLLNLVISDRNFLYSDLLGKLPYPHLYTMFIGWIPIALALLCLRLAQRKDYRILLFLAASAALAIFMGSTLPLKWLQPRLTFLEGLRFAPMIGGLSVPPIIGLSSYALDRLLKLKWPVLNLGLTFDSPVFNWALNLRWLLLIPLLFALKSGLQFSRLWLYNVTVDPGVIQLLQHLKTPDLQWVEPPFGNHVFIEPAVAMGLKISPGIMTWRWKDRDFPIAVLKANPAGPPPLADAVVDEVYGVPIYAVHSQPYAAVMGVTWGEACKASGTGGDLQVTCSNTQPGTLVLQENSYTGWLAWRDGSQVPLLVGKNLQVDAPAGEHRYRFRYLPWDVPSGFLLFIAGIFLGLKLWFHPLYSIQEEGIVAPPSEFNV
jgi:hypothetical protein